ncbi:MAG: discoidin domain-containing protein, partial [Planctomycetota bacterium]
MRRIRHLLACCLGAAVAVGIWTGGAVLAEDVPSLVEADWIDQDRAFVLPKPEPQKEANADAVTTRQDAAGGCDGVKTGGCGFHTASGEQDPWWQVDLGGTFRLDRVVVYNRTDGNTAPRTQNLRVLVAGDAEVGEFTEVYQHNGETFFGVKEDKPLVVDLRAKDVAARIVRLHVPGRCSFALDEVEVYAADDPEKNVALGKPADQKSTSPYSYPGTRGHKLVSPTPKPAEEPQAPQFLLAHTRAVVERGRKLVERLRLEGSMIGVAGVEAHRREALVGEPPAEDRSGASLRSAASHPPLKPLIEEIEAFDSRLRKLEAAGDVPENVRRRLYFEARRLVRRLAFSNPLLDFDRILFVKRHDP